MRNTLLALLALAAFAFNANAAAEDDLTVAARGLHAAAFPRDGSLAVIASLTQGASLWDLSTRERRFDWSHRKDARSTITAVAFSPEGGVALTVEGSTLVLWDAHKGAALRFFSAPAEVLSAALTRGGALALLGLRDGSALLMDARAGGIKRRFAHTGEVLAVAIDPAGTRAMTGSADGNAVLWDTQTGEALHRFAHGAPVEVVAISDDATRVFSAGRGATAQVHDADGGQTLGDFTPGPARRARGAGYLAAAFSADGSELLLGEVDGDVLLADASTARELGSWTLPRGGLSRAAGSRVVALGFSAQGPIAASGDGVIHRLQRPSAR